MSLEKNLLAIEKQFWTGGPEAYQEHCDQQCLVVFTEMAGVMAKDDIAKTAEKGRWKDIIPERKGRCRAFRGLGRAFLRMHR